MFRTVSRWMIIFITSLAGIIWLYIKGPIPVIQVTTELDIMAPFWYMFTAFPILDMLLADLVILFSTYRFDIRVIELGIQVVALVLISNSRLLFLLPISGHALLLSYFILRRIFIKIQKHDHLWTELSIAIIIYSLIVYTKIVWWNDPITLGVGTVVAIVMVIISNYVLNKNFATAKAVVQ